MTDLTGLGLICAAFAFVLIQLLNTGREWQKGVVTVLLIAVAVVAFFTIAELIDRNELP